jgi:hypothetical protein
VALRQSGARRNRITGGRQLPLSPQADTKARAPRQRRACGSLGGIQQKSLGRDHSELESPPDLGATLLGTELVNAAVSMQSSPQGSAVRPVGRASDREASPPIAVATTRTLLRHPTERSRGRGGSAKTPNPAGGALPQKAAGRKHPTTTAWSRQSSAGRGRVRRRWGALEEDLRRPRHRVIRTGPRGAPRLRTANEGGSHGGQPFYQSRTRRTILQCRDARKRAMRSSTAGQKADALARRHVAPIRSMPRGSAQPGLTGARRG